MNPEDNLHRVNQPRTAAWDPVLADINKDDGDAGLCQDGSYEWWT